MKLDELKGIWENYTEDTPKMEQEELETLLKGRTKTALQKIQRNIRLEGGVLVLFILVFSVLSFINFGFYQKIIAISLIAISMLYITFYVYVSQKLNKILFIHQNLKQALEKLISLMNKFSKIYLYSTIILTPFSFSAGFFYTYFAKKGIETDVPMNVIWFVIGGIFVMMLLIYPLTKWILRKLYGKYLERLKDAYQELNDNL